MKNLIEKELYVSKKNQLSFIGYESIHLAIFNSDKWKTIENKKIPHEIKELEEYSKDLIYKLLLSEKEYLTYVASSNSEQKQFIQELLERY